MKKPALFLFAITLLCLGLSSCDSNSLPEGQYELTEKRKGFVALECGMTELVFDRTLLITNNTIQTTTTGGLQKYDITKVSDNTYSVNVVEPFSQNAKPMEFMYDASNSQLVFCGGQIVYQKK